MRLLSTRALVFSIGLLTTVGLAAHAGGGSVLETVYVPTYTSVLSPTSSYVATSYYLPTAYTYYSPTAYYTPTAYVAPTAYSYYAPTVYTDVAATSYLAPTTYYTTTYYRPPGYLFPRRVRSSYTALTPTAYYLPTVYDAAPATYVLNTPTSSTSMCVETPANGTGRPINAGASASNTGGGTAASGPITSTATNGMPEPPPVKNVKSALDEGANPSKVAIPPPDAPPAKEKAEGSPPAIPVGPGEDASVKRNVMKPKPGEIVMQPAKAKALLQGKVTSGATAAPVPGAKVVLTNAAGTFQPKTIFADEKGLFEIRFLPSGDWTVEVEDAAGKAQSYGTLTVSGGRVTDSDGREWTSLNLNR